MLTGSSTVLTKMYTKWFGRDSLGLFSAALCLGKNRGRTLQQRSNSPEQGLSDSHSLLEFS